MEDVLCENTIDKNQKDKALVFLTLSCISTNDLLWLYKIDFTRFYYGLTHLFPMHSGGKERMHWERIGWGRWGPINEILSTASSVSKVQMSGCLK